MKTVQPYYEEADCRQPVMGFYTKGIKNLKEATKALEDYIQNDSEDFLENYKESYGESFVFKADNIKQTVYQTHRECGVETIDGDGYCAECGFDAVLNGNGRTTFIFVVK